MSRITIFVIFLTILTSCKNKKQDLNNMAGSFADIECRAMALREKRFALANQIRFTQDTLMHASKITDTARLKTNLKAYNFQKENILQISLNLADSIKHHLDSLMQNHLTTPDDKAQFNGLLKIALHERSCIE